MLEFAGLSFPVCRVRYSGPTDHRGSRWIATIKRDGKTYRSVTPYMYEMPTGSRQAEIAARALYHDVREKMGLDTLDDAVVSAICGDLDRDSYSFTLVPCSVIRAECERERLS